MPDAQDKDLFAENGKNDSVVAHAQLPQARKLSFQDGAGIRARREFSLDLVKDPPSLDFADAGKILLHALLVSDVKGQGISSFPGRI